MLGVGHIISTNSFWLVSCAILRVYHVRTFLYLPNIGMLDARHHHQKSCLATMNVKYLFVMTHWTAPSAPLFSQYVPQGWEWWIGTKDHVKAHTHLNQCRRKLLECVHWRPPLSTTSLSLSLSLQFLLCMVSYSTFLPPFWITVFHLLFPLLCFFSTSLVHLAPVNDPQPAPTTFPHNTMS